MDNNRGTQFKRTMKMMFILGDKWWSAGELAKEFNVTKKTIRRTLMFIEEVGVPVIEQIDHISAVDEQRGSSNVKRFMIETRWMKRFL